MKKIWTVLFVLWILCPVPRAGGQNRNGYSCRVRVKDAGTREPLGFAVVVLKNADRSFSGSSDRNGECLLEGIPAGHYQLQVSFLGYATFSRPIEVDQDRDEEARLAPSAVEMAEVIVTASESKGMTASSTIDRKAMEHLQPSSFTDLLELLPGGRSSDPDMGGVNSIRLREAYRSSDSDYDISSLGTSFVMDGAPISTGANMSYVSGTQSTEARERFSLNRGVDMRTISTDDIQRVEVVRGIASVEYGDLTSGLVKIERRKGGNDLNARFKADAQSKLVYVGKGFERADKGLTLNAGIDFLDSKIDPRDNLKNYKRLTASLRLSKTWEKAAGTTVFGTSLDYGGSFDNEKTDPDINYHKEDSYESSYNRFAWTSSLSWSASRSDALLQSLSLNTSFSFQRDRIEQVRYVQLSRDMPTPNSKEEGEHDGVYLPYNYVASLEVDGRPVNAFAKVTASLNADAGRTTNRIKIGADWKMDKNLGEGEIYDPLRPVYPGVTTRPRPYNAIPAGHDLSFFAEDRSTVPFGNHRMEIAAGVRATTMLNLPKSYRLRGTFFFDPRVNVLWKFPTLTLYGKPLTFEVGGGAGWHTKTPTLNHLYPDPYYYDLPQLNYYHPNPEYRRLNLKTYIIDLTNAELSAARNFKWELRGDIAFAGNRLSVTYFQEDMSSGFRTGTKNKTLTYKKYDNNSIDPDALQGPPRLEDMTYTTDTIHCIYGITTNGTRLLKEGVEFQFTSKRIPSLHTRLTINGAWFRTTYSNSQPYYYQPDDIIDGKRIPYIGIYDDPEGYVMHSFNTNFMLDTDIPKLKLGFSFSAQCLWFCDMQTQRKSGVPFAYIDLKGDTHPYTEASAQDMHLQWLTRHYNDRLFDRDVKEPFNINFNLKVTKRLYQERISLAFFVNKLLSYYPDYTRHGVTVRQVGRSPYFGMELDFKL